MPALVAVEQRVPRRGVKVCLLPTQASHYTVSRARAEVEPGSDFSTAESGVSTQLAGRPSLEVHRK